MHRISNGEPVVYHHICNSNRKGLLMTDEELKEFLVNNLVECYRECGTHAEVVNKSSRNNTFWSLLHKAQNDTFTPDIRLYDVFGSDSINIESLSTTATRWLTSPSLLDATTPNLLAATPSWTTILVEL